MFFILAIMICYSMIVLDSMVQSVFSLVIIDLCRSSIDISSLICYLSIIFMVYSWIKIKLKVLIYPTTQKPYCRHFSFMAVFVDALRPTPFTGMHFKRWQVKATLWLTAMNVFWVSEGKPDGVLLLKRRKNIRKPTQFSWVL